MFSEALRIMDENTALYMIDEQKKEIEACKNIIVKHENTIADQNNTIADQSITIADQSNTIADQSNTIADISPCGKQHKTQKKLDTYCPHFLNDIAMYDIFIGLIYESHYKINHQQHNSEPQKIAMLNSGILSL